MAPKGTYVTIDNEEDDMHGETGYVFRGPGDERPDGSTVPSGWCEVTFDPMDHHGFYTEQFRTENIKPLAC